MAVEEEVATTTSERAAPTFNLTPNIDGYVEKDTAGQTNMFATVTRPVSAILRARACLGDCGFTALS
jgi:hypothetical protein